MNTKYLENFLHNVAYLRRQYGLSKKKMAEILGVSVKTLNKMESGKLPPRTKIDVLINISDYFHISVHTQVSSRLGK